MVVAFYVWQSGPTEAAPVSVAVLPLIEDVPDEDSEWFSDGMTDAVITELAQIDNLRVIARNSVMRYKGTAKSLSEIGRELNVRYLVDGSVRKDGDSITITARLAEAGTDQYVWGDRYESNMVDVLDIQSRIAGAVATEIHGELSPEFETRVSRSRQVDPRIYEALSQGYASPQEAHPRRHIKRAGLSARGHRAGSRGSLRVDRPRRRLHHGGGTARPPQRRPGRVPGLRRSVP